MTEDSPKYPPSGLTANSEDAVEDRLSRISLPRRRFFNDMPDKGLFAAVAIGGFAIITYAKTHEFNSTFVAVLAVALMIGYGIASFQIPSVRLRTDRLGDNFYYLGFTFTLASLAAALLQLEHGASIDALLGSFGIALFTTIVGIAGRVLFVQMRGDLDEVEDQVRRDLLATSADLRGQLSLALTDFETFHLGVRQASTQLGKDSPVVAAQVIEKIGDVAKAAGTRINEAFSNEQAKAESLAISVGNTATAVEKLAEGLNEHMNQFHDRLDEMLNQLAETVDRIDQHGRRTRRRWYWPFGLGR